MNCVQLVAYVSQHGLHGEFHFVQQNDNSIEIESKVETTLQYPDQIWSWSIHEMPTDYREVDPGRRCHPANFGNKLIDFDNHLGYLQLPGNETTKWQVSPNITGEFNYFMAVKCISVTLSPMILFRQSNHLGEIACATKSGQWCPHLCHTRDH